MDRFMNGPLGSGGSPHGTSSQPGPMPSLPGGPEPLPYVSKFNGLVYGRPDQMDSPIPPPAIPLPAIPAPAPPPPNTQGQNSNPLGYRQLVGFFGLGGAYGQ